MIVVDASGAAISPGARETSEAHRRPKTVATNAATTPDASAELPNAVTESAPRAMTCGRPAMATVIPPDNAPLISDHWIMWIPVTERIRRKYKVVRL